jgi:hypothetical protein
MSLTMIIVGVVAVLIVILLLVPVLQRSNKVSLAAPSETKPEWMRELPPVETLQATKEDGEGVTLFDYDKGEKLAAPFAEQIEDIVRARMKADPALKDIKIDFGTGEDHSLEIWVNDKKYKNISELPNERLKQIMHEAVQKYQK